MNKQYTYPPRRHRLADPDCIDCGGEGVDELHGQKVECECVTKERARRGEEQRTVLGHFMMARGQ
jgi:hypothetical protein